MCVRPRSSRSPTRSSAPGPALRSRRARRGWTRGLWKTSRTIAVGSGRPYSLCSRSKGGCDARARSAARPPKIKTGTWLVSPDERTVHQVIDAARRRAGLLAAAEAAAWGAAAAAISPVGGGVVALALAVWQSRAVTRSAVVRALERASPDARNLLITADEL